MPLEQIQTCFRGAIVKQDWRAERGCGGVLAFGAPSANDNLAFDARVKAEIAEAARAIGEPYTERELQNIAAYAAEFARSARNRLAAKRG